MAGTMLQAIPFVHPGLAAAALAAGLIPVLVHLINRRRYVRVPWAAMSFLLAANRRSAQRVRLEQALLLLARVALIVLLGLAVARPYVAASSLLPLRASRVHRVLLLDNSLSMNAATETGATRFQAARRFAENLLDSFPATDAVSIVTLASPAEAVIAQGAYDRRLVRERLAAVEPTQRSTDTVGALTAAIELVDASDAAEGNRVVYLISDFPRDTWSSETPDEPTAAARATRQLADRLADSAADLTLVRIAADAGANVAVTDLTVPAPLVGLHLPTRIDAVVTNEGPSTARNLTLQVRRDGQIIRRQTLPPLGPGESTLAAIATEFSTPGTHLIEAKLTAAESSDALPDDNTRYLSIEVREATPVLLVDGRTGATPLTGQTGFLATALSPGRTQTRPNLIAPKTVTEAEFAGEALGEYDVVALGNVQRLPPETWKRLEDFVSRGGGLMIFGGDLVNVDHYNRYGYADGAGLLPGRLRRAGASPTDGGAALGLRLDEPAHPVVAEFVDHPESGLFSARIDRYLPIEPDPGRADVVLRYTNGDAAVVASTFGKGTVLLFTTTANMDWTNLPAKGDYVSLMLSAAAFLSPRHGDHRNIMVGRAIQEPLTPTETSMPLRVATGEGASAEPALVPDGDRLALAYGPIERAGAWTASIGSTVRIFAANVDPAESNLTPIDDRTLLDTIERPVRLITDPTTVAGEPTAARTTELASIALWAVLALLGVEMWMAAAFGSRRGGAPVLGG